MKKLFRLLPALLLCAPLVRAQDDGSKPEFPQWAKVGKNMEVSEGFWNVLQDKKKSKFWVEIPTGELNRPFLVATSIMGGTPMAGWQWNDWLLVWELHERRLVLLERNVGYIDKDNTLKEAVERTYTDRVLASYPIRCRGPNGGYVLDGEGLFAGGASLFFGPIGRSRDSSLAKFTSKNFADNTEISVQMPAAKNGELMTLHFSVSRMRHTSYKPRKADDRIGYFLTVLKDFSDSNKDEHRTLRYINRWNLVKRDPKLKLSPPKEPIVFYIENTVPVRLRRYVREGIEEWNKAFEKIGYDQAIVVLQQTKEQYADLEPENVNYNFFRWIVSDQPFAMGPSRVNPETGQILDADIIFDDSYVRYTLQDYRMYIKKVPADMLGEKDRKALLTHPMAKLGIVPGVDDFAAALPKDAPRPFANPYVRRAYCSIGEGAREQLGLMDLWLAGNASSDTPPKGMEDLPEEVIGQFVKDTVMHEVGHTLGLRHNFKGSTYRTLDDIDSDKKPPDIGGSVMDYNPLVIAPKGRPQGNFCMRTIGPYDYWAIEYGYTDKDKDLEKIASRVAEKGLAYATDEDTWSFDPDVNRWDMGSDPLQYAEQRVALMKRLRKNLVARAVDKGEGYQRLRRAVDMQFYEGLWSGALAVRHVGGEHIHRDHRGDPNARPPLVPVSAAKQREALHFVCDEFLSGRYFDFKPDLLEKLAPDYWGEDWLRLFSEGHGYPYLDNVLSVQYSLLYGLTAPERMARVLGERHKVPAGQDTLTPPEVFDAVQATIFGDLNADVTKKASDQDPAIPDMKRNLQREYVSHLIWILLKGEGLYPAAIQTLARHYILALRDQIGKALQKGAGTLDTSSLAHLEECKARLDHALNASYSLPG